MFLCLVLFVRAWDYNSCVLFGRCTQTSLPLHRSPLIAHRSPLIAQRSTFTAHRSSACHWKFFTKPYFRINPAGKSKVPSWKIFISQQENYFFSVGKSKFRSRAILDDFLGLFLNYFKRLLFILTLSEVRGAKVKMFDIGRWAMSCELRVVNNEF